ncbi:hypothetical protein [Streptomyces sp. A1547]|uniref:hypothetical protein n=1 Tax=Streptomyces sp. A1547 TaxID=2563105 RepID=UPI00109EB8D5|nr:hypothetical protein [Streptomyces sp. A1547]THA33724.1 hypothetical protein E6W17_30985 [Streptomyces sp. A1547]
MTTDRPPTIDQALEAVLETLDSPNLLGTALRAEQAKTGATANDLGKRVKAARSRPLILKALNRKP